MLALLLVSVSGTGTFRSDKSPEALDFCPVSNTGLRHCIGVMVGTPSVAHKPITDYSLCTDLVQE